jgi:hypothetical protein
MPRRRARFWKCRSVAAENWDPSVGKANAPTAAASPKQHSISDIAC